MEFTFKAFPPPLKSGPRILIVDDDPKSVAAASELLREADAKILVAKSGMEALEWFYNETPIDLVLLDLYMPDMNGFKTFEALRNTEWFCTRRIPVIAMSSTMLAEPKAQFLKSTGFKDYITKPLHAEQLLPMVQLYAPHGDLTESWY